MIKSVKSSGTASAPILTVKGSGFGWLANLGPALAPCGGGSGSDYANTLYVSDLTRPWYAGDTCDVLGLYVTSYSNTKIVFHFPSILNRYGGMQSGDKVTVTVLGVAKTITASV